jgi:uncharacterized damage-inducible protein DinB
MFYSSQAAELRAFLRDRLGLKGSDVGEGWLIFDAPEADLGVHPTDAKGPASGTADISFYCHDIAGTVRELKSRGVEFTQDIEDHGYGLVTFFEVPGGFKVQLYQAKYTKSTGKAYRKGAVGAMMDEYERALDELVALIRRLSDEEFLAVRDRQTKDEDCRSIQTVMRHVASAGYGYAVYIRQATGEKSERPQVPLEPRLASLDRLAAVRSFTEATLADKWEWTDQQIMGLRIQSPWGPVFDLEQMLEHAIVHVLRHRRQIERFLSEPQFRPS